MHEPPSKDDENILPEGLTEAEMLEAIRRSGYPLEQEIATQLQARGYIAQPNANFEDQDTGDSREVDVLATKSVLDDKMEIILDHRLCVECKSNSHPLVFFPRPHYASFSRLYDYDIIGMPESFDLPRKGIVTIGEFLKLEPHTARPASATRSSQFCTIRRKGRAVHAEHSDVYTSYLLPLLKAWASDRRQYRASVSDVDLISLCVTRAILIVRAPLYLYNAGEPGVKEHQWIQFERHFDSRTVKVTALIDVVRSDFFPSYMDIVDDEVRTINKKLHKNRRQLLRIIKNKKKIYLED